MMWKKEDSSCYYIFFSPNDRVAVHKVGLALPYRYCTQEQEAPKLHL